jgi:hypothetical protein
MDSYISFQIFEEYSFSKLLTTILYYSNNASMFHLKT